MLFVSLAFCFLLGMSAFLPALYNGIIVLIYIGAIFAPLFLLLYYVPFGPFLLYGMICRIALNMYPPNHAQERQTRWFMVAGVVLALAVSISSYLTAFSLVENVTTALNASNTSIPCTGTYGNDVYYAGIKDEAGNCKAPSLNQPPIPNFNNTNAFNALDLLMQNLGSPVLIIILFSVSIGTIKNQSYQKKFIITLVMLFLMWGVYNLLKIANDFDSSSRNILCQAFPCNGLLDTSEVYSVSVLFFSVLVVLSSKFWSARTSFIISSFIAVVFFTLSYSIPLLDRITVYLFVLSNPNSDITSLFRDANFLTAITLITPLFGLVVFFVGYNYQLAVQVLLYPFLVLYNEALYWMEKALGFPVFQFHSIFFMEYQPFQWPFLYRHLILVAEGDPDVVQKYIARLAGMANHSWVAQEIQIELDARTLEQSSSVVTIGKAYQYLGSGELQGPASALLRSFSRISKDAEAAQNQEAFYNQRVALTAVEDRIDNLLRELTRSSERYALRFRRIAESWRQVIATHIQFLAAETEQRQEIDSPYITGVALNNQQEIFIGRSDISARIEQLLLDRRRPPLLLYGQRRMGKTSLLNNLGRLLPSTMIPLFVDMQGPASRSTDHTGLLYYISRSMAESARQHRHLQLPPLTRETLDRDPFGAFDEWLAEVEHALGDASGLLMLDEFEALDSAISRGRFDEESVLGTLRHIIQHRPRFKILLAGSHTLEEFRRWSSYLINVQVVQIGYLHTAETLQLIERPVKDFALRYEPDASQRIIALTRGHPFLVQLLCAEVVALKNTQEPTLRRLARLEDVEDALPEALTSGDMFFADIARNQIDARGLALLRHLASLREGTVADRAVLLQQEPDLDEVLRLLMQRDLIESVDGGYRFQVELIRRWFVQEQA